MTLVISTDNASETNDAILAGSPAVLISGNGVTLTNRAGGEINGSGAGQPAISITGSNSLIVNRSGARIAAEQGYYDAIRGGAGSDRVDNYGVIYGWARLGGGADTFNQYFAGANVSTANVDLGGGDDAYNLLVGTGPVLFGTVDGGAGVDRLYIGDTSAIVYGFNFLNFEHLTLGANVTNLVSFSGLTSLTLTPGGFNNFVGSSNPNLDVALDGNTLGVSAGSAFRNVTGSANSDFLNLSTNSASPASSVASALLGGGSDQVTIIVNDAASPLPIVTGTADGGTGFDYLQIITRSTQVFDLAKYTGFESLFLMTQVFDTGTVARFANAAGFETISCNAAEAFAISDSYLPNASITAGFRGKLTLEATTTVGFYGYAAGSAYNPYDLADLQVGDTQFNLSVTNRGAILGAVQLYLGDDVYDGRLGSTGGTIFGHAGNDTLLGGAGGERIEGGYGNDTLDGGGGIDTLLGQAGDDRLVVAAGGSGTRVDGGTGTDTLAIAGSVTLGGIAGIEAVDLQSGGALTLGAAQFATGLASNATLGGSGSLTIDMGASDSELYLQQLIAGAGSTAAIIVNGSAGDDTVKGALGLANTIHGGNGFDSIRGGTMTDTLDGGSGDDKLEGGQGADILTGGTGADLFRYQSANAAGVGAAADRITDFAIGADRLGFALIDADPVAAGDQAFGFIGTAAFTSTGVGQVRYQNSGSNLLVQLDLDGNGTADMEIVLAGLAGQSLSSGDFLL